MRISNIKLKINFHFFLKNFTSIFKNLCHILYNSVFSRTNIQMNRQSGKIWHPTTYFMCQNFGLIYNLRDGDNIKDFLASIINQGVWSKFFTVCLFSWIDLNLSSNNIGWNVWRMGKFFWELLIMRYGRVETLLCSQIIWLPPTKL